MRLKIALFAYFLSLTLPAAAAATRRKTWDTTAPLITGVAVSGVSGTGATVAWTTDEAADTQVEYGPTSAYGASTVLNTYMTTAHTAAASGLAAATVYHYRVKSKDAAGNLAASSDSTFTTASAVAVPAPSGCVTSAGTWQNTAFATQTGAFTAEFDATPSMTRMDGVAGLSSGMASDYTSIAAGVRFNSSGFVDARNGGAFAAAASFPYSAGASYHFRLAVNMTARTYSVYVKPAGGVETLIGSSFAFRTEQAGATSLSSLGVFASAGGETACALAVASSVNSSVGPVISGVTTSGVGTGGASILWATNALADTQVEYGLTASYGSSTALDTFMTTSHTGNLLALSPSTLYHYRARSRDAAGGLTMSPDYTFTTNAVTALPPPVNSFTDDFASYPKNVCFADGTSFGPWLAAYSGYGCIDTATDAAGSYIEEAPQASATPAETHASMVLGPAFSGPIVYSLSFKTVAQLRTGSAPNPWEVAWVAWNYKDDTHFYYLALKPNGWELGKEDPAYPGAQRFLASGDAPVYPIGAWYGVQIQQDAANVIRVYVDGRLVTSFTDAERPYTSGRIAFYNEDARVRLRQVAVNVTAPAAEPAIGIAANGIPSKSGQKLLSPSRADGINDAAVFGAGAAEVNVYDINGKAVFHGSQQGGAPIVWNGRDGASQVVESGVYIAKIRETGAGVVFQSFVVAK